MSTTPTAYAPSRVASQRPSVAPPQAHLTGYSSLDSVLGGKPTSTMSFSGGTSIQEAEVFDPRAALQQSADFEAAAHAQQNPQIINPSASFGSLPVQQPPTIHQLF